MIDVFCRNVFLLAHYLGPRNYAGETAEEVKSKYREGTFNIDFVNANDNTLECMAVSEGVVVKK